MITTSARAPASTCSTVHKIEDDSCLRLLHFNIYGAFSSLREDMAAGWTDNATRALLSVYGEQNVQEQLNGVKRNRHIY